MLFLYQYVNILPTDFSEYPGFFTAIAAVMIFSASTLNAADYYVSTGGSDETG